jgi:hypothetical protein
MTRPPRKRALAIPGPVEVMVQMLFKDERRAPRTEVVFANTPGAWDRDLILERYGIPDHFRVWVREPGEPDRVIQQGRPLW